MTMNLPKYIRIRTYGVRINSIKPEFHVVSTDEGYKRIGFSETVNALMKVSNFLSSWEIKVPSPIPWYSVIPCKYCKEIIQKRYEKSKVMFDDWYWLHCKRHAAAEFLGEISIIDNKDREIFIDLENKKISINVCTSEPKAKFDPENENIAIYIYKHEAIYVISEKKVEVTFDGIPFTFKPHVNSYPLEPAYNRIVKSARSLIDELTDILMNPKKREINIYFNHEPIHKVKQ